MPAAGRRRTYGIVATSVAAHAVLLGLMALHTPRLRVSVAPAGPPEAIIPVLIMPRTPAPAATPGARPSAIRLHRRPQRFNLDDLPLAPLLTPQAAPPPRPAAAPGPRSTSPQPANDALAENARRALRGRMDCNSPTLTRAEREACQNRFADGARDAPFLGLGLDRDKAGDLARAAARREQDFNYKRAPAPSGAGVSGTGRNAGAIERPGAPNMGMGATGDDLSRMSGGDSRGAAKVPF